MATPEITPADRAFIEAFEACTLTTDQFHHHDHVRLAWLYLCEASLPETMMRFRTNLQRFAESHGQGGLYHETITYTFLLLINERMARQSDCTTWDAFAAHNPDLLKDGRTTLNRYYHPDTLASDLARRVFVMPDRCGA